MSTTTESSDLGEAGPSYSKLAEEIVLGAMLLDQGAVDEANVLLTPDDFYVPEHRAVFVIINELASRKAPGSQDVTVAVLCQELHERAQLDEVGGKAFVEGLVDPPPTAGAITFFAEKVRQRSLERQKKQAEQPEEDRTLHVKPLLMRAYDAIERSYQHKGQAPGLSTGFYDLDDITSGLAPGDLMVVASAPSMGKTSLCLNIAHFVAWGAKLPAIIFSLETSQDRVVERLICADAEINSRDLRRGFLQDQDWHRVTNAVNDLYQSPLFINADPDLPLPEIKRVCRSIREQHGPLGLVVVDSLQMLPRGHRYLDRADEVTASIRTLKVLADQLQVPVLLCSQLLNPSESVGTRPTLSHLSSKGEMSAIADTVAFVHRPDLYKPRLQRKGSGRAFVEPDLDFDPDANVAEIIVAKQRNGPVGMVRLGFFPEFGRFTNLSSEPTEATST